MGFDYLWEGPPTPGVPGVPSAIGLDVVNNLVYTCNGRTWVKVNGGGSGGPNFADGEVPLGAIDGSNITYTWANTPNPQASLILVWNGLVLQQGIGYTQSGPQSTFASAPSPGDDIVGWYRY